MENWTPFIRSDSYFKHYYLRNPLKYFDESAVRCVCSRYVEVPFNA